MHAHHPDVHRVAVGHDACGHQGISRRDLGLLQQVAQGLAGSCAAHAAAKVDQRALRRIDQVCRPLHLLRVEGGHGTDRLRIFGGELTHRRRHVLGDIHQHRALAAALCNAEGRAHGIGQILYPAHREVVLGNGHRDALNVGFLKAVLAKARRGYVAGEGHHGHRVHIGCGNAGDQIGGTRAAGSQHHAGASGGAGIAVCRVSRALLVGGEHMGDAVRILVQLIVKVQHCAAGITKKGVHALLAQDLYKDLRTIQLHGVAPIPVPLLIHSLRESF